METGGPGGAARALTENQNKEQRTENKSQNLYGGPSVAAPADHRPPASRNSKPQTPNSKLPDELERLREAQERARRRAKGEE